ncbi:right-handed parallel beta-helix repeat-containing protein [Catellatospora sp. NPDC049609]|uniref:right-handed parallel beta-helix repeat-containing protein n=1 Tax=Catellatospora sp. NPDC049609 TaxID=3155505 RepID=UPI00341918A6
MRPARVVAGLTACALLMMPAACDDAAPEDRPGAGHQPGGLAAPTPSSTWPWSASSAVTCPRATVTVGDAQQLADALAAVGPGDSIRLRDGVYRDRFTATTPGTASRPVHLCGGTGAVLDGGGTGKGYALHLDGADHWRLAGFTVRNAQKGVMLDRTSHTVLTGLTVEHVGDEAIHLRAFSSDNLVQGNTIRDTGRRRKQYGEGVYVGTAESNWCDISDCAPDRSDRNTIRDNRISATTAEPVDIKEGTTGGVLSGNTFDGSALSGSYADSWVDVKGNGWLIEGNTGRDSRGDGFQTHRVADGWGEANVFTGNTADVDGPGWGFHLAPVGDNVVACDNTVTDARKGMANTSCRRTW